VDHPGSPMVRLSGSDGIPRIAVGLGQRNQPWIEVNGESGVQRFAIVVEAGTGVLRLVPVDRR
jgi:hypothetical protein